MLKALCLLVAPLLVFLGGPRESGAATTDLLQTAAGPLEIVTLGHGTLYFTWQGKVFHVDPWTKQANYAALPKADVILITHEHKDHLDAEAVAAVSKPDTVLLLTQKCQEALGKGQVMKNGDVAEVQGVKVEAVPAYNLIHKRENGQPFHPKGAGSGYVLTFGDKRVYVAGDTENIPEMKDLTNIDVAFLPMNLPYTMTPEMTAAAAESFLPKILYPYHYGDTDPTALQKLLAGKPVEVRVREMR